MKTQHLWVGILAACCLLGGSTAPSWAQEKLEHLASWATPKYAEGRQMMLDWRDSLQLEPAQIELFNQHWPAESAELSELQMLDRAAETVAAIVPEAKEILDFCRQATPPRGLPEFALLKEELVPADQEPVVLSPASQLPRRVMRLYLGRWLVQHQLYDEAVVCFGDLQPADVLAPATLLFHQSVAHHRLLQKDQCLPKVAQLLENEADIPRRYRDVSRLMAADLKPLETDSLDEVSRLMDDVRRRLDLGRAGKRVRDQEDEVIAKLDKMIEEIEKQQQQQQQQAGGAGGGAPNQPLPDSVPAGGRGPGNVAQRDIGRGSGWGNLPPREREEALQEITKNLPSHYREVIEEYFRKLARTE